MPELKIERYETIIVETAQKNNYGDLVVNGKLKVGNKRSWLFDAFQIGAEVKLGYAIYKNKEFIATAEQTGNHIATEGHLVKAAKEMGAEVVSEKPIIHDTRNRSMAIAYAKDLAAAGKIELKDMAAYADKFLEYINK